MNQRSSESHKFIHTQTINVSSSLHVCSGVLQRNRVMPSSLYFVNLLCSCIPHLILVFPLPVLNLHRKRTFSHFLHRIYFAFVYPANYPWYSMVLFRNFAGRTLLIRWENYWSNVGSKSWSVLVSLTVTRRRLQIRVMPREDEWTIARNAIMSKHQDTEQLQSAYSSGIS